MGVFFCYALKYGPFLGRFKMVYCAIILRIIRSAYINHFETPTNLSYMRPALASGSESLRLGEREVSGISYDHYIISQLNSTYSCLISQPALVRRDVDMQLFSLLMNASLSITAS